MTAVQVQVPIEVKIFVPAQTAKLFRLAPQVPLHLAERFLGIDDGEMTALLHLFDFLENLDQLLGFVIHQAGIAETQVTRSQVRQRITKRAALESQAREKL